MHDEIVTYVGSNQQSPEQDESLPLQHALCQEQAAEEIPPAFDIPPNLIAADSNVITPEMLTLVELSQHQIDSIVRTVPGGAANVQDIYPLTPLQEGSLFHRLLNERSDSYVLSTLFELPSHAEVDLLIHAVQRVIDRHDILRSAVQWADLPRPVQIVYRRAFLPTQQLPLDP